MNKRARASIGVMAAIAVLISAAGCTASPSTSDGTSASQSAAPVSATAPTAVGAASNTPASASTATGSVAATESAAPGMRLAAIPLTAGVRNAGAAQGEAAASAKGSFRLPIKIAPHVARWRLHMSTYTIGKDTHYGTDVKIAGAWIGRSAGGAAFAKAPTRVLDAQTLPQTDDVISDWQTAPLGDNVETLLGYTVSDFQSAPSLESGFAWATKDATTPRVTAAKEMTAVPLEIWLEVEVPATTPVLLAVGDSTGIGVGTDRPMYNATANIWARQHGALATIVGSSGAMTEDFHATDGRLRRYSGFTVDAAMVTLGVQDTMTGADRPVDRVSSDMKQTIADIRSVWAPQTIYAVAPGPSNREVPASREATRRAFNQWFTSAQKDLGLTQIFNGKDPAVGLTVDDENISQSYTTDRLHLNTAGCTKLAAAWGDLGLPHS